MYAIRSYYESVAVVVAPSKEKAEDIADEVRIDIEETAPLVDAREALAPDAPLIHAEAPGNVIVEGVITT